VYIAACVIVFVLAYVLNIVTISVGYHRGLAHGAVHLGARAKRALLALGPWVTGLDPKAWVVMHRLHHAHSDTALDPHSPVQVGLLGVVRAQLRSYERVIIGLAKRDPAVTRFAADLNFELSWSVRRPGRWFVPYLVHAAIAVVVGVVVGPLLGVAWFAGMMSHPVQGALVNALGHAVGAQNFENGDNSRNNLLTAWLILGEGLQNNHHHAPASARFSYAPHEVDPGWAVCLVLDALGVVEVQHNSVLPRLRAPETAAAVAVG
jgi:stearoyl-CoA desaturase (delta-9 desaturase)